MRGAILSSIVLASSMACTGCSSGEGDNGGGATGGTGGPLTAFSFDEESAEQATSATAVALDMSTKFGTVMSNLLSALGSGVSASPVGVGPKALIPIPSICSQGEATLDWSGSGVSQQPPFLTQGDVLTLTFVNCAGSPVSTGAANGTIILSIVSASGGLPYIGGIIDADAELDLSISPDISISGSFGVSANLPNFSLANLTFGAANSDERSPDDRITFTQGFFQTELACFEIYQRVSLGAPSIQFFRPLGVMSLDGQIFTLNDFASTPPNLSFEFMGFDATPVRGSLELKSGDLSSVCSRFSGSPAPNPSSVEATFTGGGCVTLDGTDTAGEDFLLVRTWDSLLEVGRPGDPAPQCDDGGGGSGGAPSSGAVPGPETCDPDSDIFPIADTFIQGMGPEGDERDTNFSTRTSLLVKSVSNLYFTRKIYIRFDLGDAPETFDAASLVLTLEFHPGLGPNPVNVFGITAPPDWDLATLPEDAITWNNAPRNLNSWVAGMQFENSPDVPLLIAGYDFDLGGDDVQDEPGTRYALDITDYVRGRQMAGATGVTILMAVYNPDGVNEDGSVFFSKEVRDEQECDRPFLLFE